MMVVDDISTWDVLIVDDEPSNLDVLQYVLNHHNAKVRMASSGRKGLQMMEQSTPSLILLDIQMPELSGWDVLREIRNNKDFQHLPVIAVTGYVLAGDRERILEEGFDGYIPKPISPLGLVNYLKTILNSRPPVMIG